MLGVLTRFYHCDSVEVALGMLLAALPHARNHGVDFSPLEARLKPGVRAFVRFRDLKVVLDDLLVNAVRAVATNLERRVSFFIELEPV